MPNKKRKLAIVVSVIAVLLLNTAMLALAQSITDLKPTENLSIKEKVKRSEEQKGSDASDTEKVLKNAIFLLELQKQLKDASSNYQKNYETFSKAKTKLGEVSDQTTSLKQQILRFNDVIENTNNKIKVVSGQIAGYHKSLINLYSELEVYKIAYQEQRKLLENYVRMLYEKENQYISFESNGEISAIKVLLADASVSDAMQSLRYLETLEKTGQNMVRNISRQAGDLQNKQIAMEEQKAQLDALKERLSEEKEMLIEQKIAKAELLKATHGEEEVYRKLVSQYLAQQEESLAEISALRDNMKFIDKKMKELGSSASITDLQALVDQRTRDIYAFQNISDPNAVFNWPVKPSRGLSAYFRDSAYKATFGIPHNAIDIPVPQGTPMASSRDGYIYKIKDNGTGYSYIIMTHTDSFMTVYGHVSEILVKEGQFVKAGDTIALSGGMPGTKGAGFITTGPHVHFEILKEGMYIDPLNYLSLLPLPLELLPTKYVDKLMKEKSEADSESVESGSEAPVTKENIEKAIEENEKRESEVYQKMMEKSAR